jgi:hypothetical protein
MRARCQTELKEERPGFCAGFVFAIFDHLMHAHELCIPPWFSDGDVLRIAIYRLENKDADPILTIANGLREAWPGPCKK